MDALMTIGFINILAALVMAGASLFDWKTSSKALHISEEPGATITQQAILALKMPPPPVESTKVRHAVRGPNGRFVKKG